MNLTDKLSEEALSILRSFGEDAVDFLNNEFWPIAPDLVERLIKTLYDDAYRRGHISLRERHIATLSSVIALGDSSRQLRFQGNAAFRLGFTWEEVEEILIQNSIFAGFTRAMNAAVVLNETYKSFLKTRKKEEENKPFL